LEYKDKRFESFRSLGNIGNDCYTFKSFYNIVIVSRGTLCKLPQAFKIRALFCCIAQLLKLLKMRIIRIGVFTCIKGSSF